MAAFYLDADVSPGIATALVSLGHAATTAIAQQLRRAHDAQQLLTASQRGWTLLIHNYPDYLLLHRAWQLWRHAGAGYALPDHPGILRIPQQRWLDEEAARQIDAFLRTRPPLANMLYQWIPNQGWVSRY